VQQEIRSGFGAAVLTASVTISVTGAQAVQRVMLEILGVLSSQLHVICLTKVLMLRQGSRGAAASLLEPPLPGQSRLGQ
jgi:hypothetical protein